MTRKVPYRWVPGIPLEANRQLARNFEVAQKLMTEGGRMKVPYQNISGLPLEAQREIRRNFQDLECDCAGTSYAPETIITSDSFARGATATQPPGYTDNANGGSVSLPWSPASGTWVCDATFSGALSHTANQVSNSVPDLCFLDPGVLDVRVEITCSRPNNTGSYVGVIARGGDTDDFVCLIATNFGSGYQVYLFQRVAGTDTNLSSSPFSISTPSAGAGGVTLKLEVIGSTAYGYYGGTLLGSGTISGGTLLTATRSGCIHQYAGSSSIESYKITAL